jgi:hypothetical protein
MARFRYEVVESALLQISGNVLRKAAAGRRDSRVTTYFDPHINDGVHAPRVDSRDRAAPRRVLWCGFVRVVSH